MLFHTAHESVFLNCDDVANQFNIARQSISLHLLLILLIWLCGGGRRRRHRFFYILFFSLIVSVKYLFYILWKPINKFVRFLFIVFLYIIKLIYIIPYRLSFNNGIVQNIFLYFQRFFLVSLMWHLQTIQ